MLALDVRREGTPGAEPYDALTRSAAMLAWRWPDLPAPLVLRWSDEPVVALDGVRPWLFGPLERDPLLGTSGPAVLPRRQRRQLRERAVTGPRFDAVAVAHELDPDGPVQTLVPSLRRGPHTCDDTVARDLVGPAPAHPGVVRVAGLLNALARPGSPRFAVRAAALLLDPIVFGIVARPGPQHGVPCLWYPLAAWRW